MADIIDGDTIELRNGLQHSNDTISIDIETMQEGNVLTYDGNRMMWQQQGLVYAEDYQTNKPEPKSMLQNFYDHFDICGPGGANIEKILKKKHSERTEEEKENIRYLMRQDKAEKPKISLPENTFHVPYGGIAPIDGTIYFNTVTDQIGIIANEIRIDNMVTREYVDGTQEG